MAQNLRSRMDKYFCETVKGKKELLHMFKCFNESSLEAMYQPLHKFTAVLDHIDTNMEVSKSIPALCCSYAHIIEVGTDYINKLCLASTGPETAETIMGNVKAIIIDIVDISCGGHSTIDMCVNKMPDFMALIRGITDNDVPEKTYTPLVPLLKIADKLQDF